MNYEKSEKYEVLKRYFGYDSFREGQEILIDGILDGRDVLGIMPTGSGKSLCYQVPALILPGITLVVSPLISLMKDQVTALNQAGVHAAYLNSSLTTAQYYKALGYAREGRYPIIYVAPERLMERFVRGDESRTTEGSGLGLSIVKHGAQYHNAQLSLDSEPGAGTTITLRFPKQSAA